MRTTGPVSGYAKMQTEKQQPNSNGNGARMQKNYKKEFFRCRSKRQIQKKNIDLLLNRKDELVTKNTGKVQVLNSFFTSVFTNSVGPQALETKSKVNANTEPLSVMEELVCELELDSTNPRALTIFP